MAAAFLLVGIGQVGGCVLDRSGTLQSSAGGSTPTGGGGQGGGGAQGGAHQGGGGQGGAGAQGGQPPDCTAPGGCPGVDSDCGHRTCDVGICGTFHEQPGTTCDDNGGDSCDGAGACLKDLATSCADGVECHSGYCADSVCCDVACDGDCVGCDLASLEGACSPHDPATDPDLDCGAGVCSGVGSCVSGAYAWGVEPTSTANFDDYGWEVVVDSAGDVIVNGDMEGPLDMGGGPMSFGGTRDLWLAKLDASGNHIWSYAFGGIDTQAVWGLGLDSGDNIFVSGQFEDDLDFFGSSTALLGTGNNPDVFVAKLDPDGTGIWARHFDDATGDGADIAFDLAVDSNGDVIIAGHFTGNITFGANTYTSVQQNDVFVARLNGDTGAPVWSSHFGGSSEDRCYGVAVDAANDIFITGGFASSIDFETTHTSAGSQDVFLAKISGGNGAALWSHRYGGSQSDRGISLAVGPDGSVHMTGEFGATLDLGSGVIVTAVNSSDGFLAKLDNNGFPLAVRGFGGNNVEVAWGVAVDGDGQVAVAGSFVSEVDLGTGMLPAFNGRDIFLARYDRDLSYVYGHVFPGSGNEFHAGVAFGLSGQIFSAGYFSNTLDLGGGDMTAAGDDAFVAGFAP